MLTFMLELKKFRTPRNSMTISHKKYKTFRLLPEFSSQQFFLNEKLTMISHHRQLT